MKKVQNINELYFNYESCGLLIKEQCLSKSVTRMSYIRKRIRTNYYNEISNEHLSFKKRYNKDDIPVNHQMEDLKNFMLSRKIIRYYQQKTKKINI